MDMVKKSEKDGKIIMFCNNKGGTGKTRTALTFSSILASRGLRVLLIDFDGQKNATTSVLGQEASTERADSKSVTSWLMNRHSAEDAIVYGGDGWMFDIMPGSVSLNIYSELFTSLNEFTVVEAIDRSQLRSKYDYIVFDTAPAINDLLMAALMAANEVVFVSTPYRESPDGIVKVYERVCQIQGNARYNPGLKIDGVLITMMQNQYRSAKECAGLVRTYFSQYVYVYNSMIRFSPRAARQSYSTQSLNIGDPSGIAAKDYTAFVDEWCFRHGLPCESSDTCSQGKAQDDSEQMSIFS